MISNKENVWQHWYQFHRRLVLGLALLLGFGFLLRLLVVSVEQVSML